MLNLHPKGDGNTLMAACARRITLREMLLMQRICDLRRHSWLTQIFLAAIGTGIGFGMVRLLQWQGLF